MQASASCFGLKWFGTVCGCLIVEPRVRTVTTANVRDVNIHLTLLYLSCEPSLCVIRSLMCKLKCAFSRGFSDRPSAAIGDAISTRMQDPKSARCSRLSFQGFRESFGTPVCPSCAGGSDTFGAEMLGEQ